MTGYRIGLGLLLQFTIVPIVIGFLASPAFPQTWLVEALMEQLVNAKEDQQYAVNVRLAQLGSAAVPALTASLGHERAEVRGRAAAVLARIGPDAQSATTRLVST